MSRYLGAERLGQLNYAMAIVSIGAVFVAMGTNEGDLEDLVRHPERRNELLGTGFAMNVTGAVVLNIVVLSYGLLKGLDTLMLLLLMIAAAGELFRWGTLIELFFISQVKGRISAKVGVAATLVSSGFKLLLVYQHAPILWFAGAYVFDCLISTVLFTIAYRLNKHHLRKWRPSLRMFKYLLVQSWPMLVYAFALQAQLKIDRVMIFDLLRSSLGEKAANAEVGQYSVAVKMIEAIAFLPVIIQLSLGPAIRARVQDIDLYRQRIANQYRLMFLLYLVTSLPLLLYRGTARGVVVRPGISDGGASSGPLCGSVGVLLHGVAKGSFIVNEGLFRFSLVAAVVGCIGEHRTELVPHSDHGFQRCYLGHLGIVLCECLSNGPDHRTYACELQDVDRGYFHFLERSGP
ncbi:MAG: oligosaccharide flippase family protein [Flavobacteriales bacterium]|nr:oligosaccharide flippase family protein [Flavobacteriales bacterium]